MPSKKESYRCIDCNKNVFTRNRKRTNVCKSCNAIRNCKIIRERGISGRRLRPFEYAYRGLLRAAKITNRIVTISYEDYLEFTRVKNCTYCDRVIPWQQYTNKNKRNCNYFIDRKNNSEDYVKENLAVCCPTCNRMKSSDFSYEEFLQIAKFINKIVSWRTK